MLDINLWASKKISSSKHLSFLTETNLISFVYPSGHLPYSLILLNLTLPYNAYEMDRTFALFYHSFIPEWETDIDASLSNKFYLFSKECGEKLGEWKNVPYNYKRLHFSKSFIISYNKIFIKLVIINLLLLINCFANFIIKRYSHK